MNAEEQRQKVDQIVWNIFWFQMGMVFVYFLLK